jgi:alkylation response protein AidB-like acyl-CoA dehydrogenase
MATDLGISSVLDSVKSLESKVEACRSEFDETRHLPEGLRGELIDRGLYRLWTPSDLGGMELSPTDAVRVIVELARLEGAFGWNAMIPAAYSMLAGHMQREAAESIFGPPDAIVAGHLQPGGKAIVAGDHYEASGHWSFGSAGNEANWFLGQCIIEGEGAPSPSVPGMPPMRLLFAPADECQIHDVWQTWGLRGTGSNDYSMDQVRIPMSHSADLFANKPVHDGALYRMPALATMIALVASVPIGIARAAVEIGTELMQTKRRFPTGELYSEREVVQAGIAHAENLVGAAEALLVHRLQAVWTAVQEGESPLMRDRALMRGAAAHVGETCVEAVDLVCELAGTNAIFQTGRLERCSRDVHTARAHIAVSHNGLVEAGSALFGGLSPTV